MCVCRTFTPSACACSPGTLTPWVLSPGECVGVVGTGTGELARWALALSTGPLAEERPLVRLPVLPAPNEQIDNKQHGSKQNKEDVIRFLSPFCIPNLRKSSASHLCHHNNLFRMSWFLGCLICAIQLIARHRIHFIYSETKSVQQGRSCRST